MGFYGASRNVRGRASGVKEAALNKKGWWRWGSLSSVDFGGGLKYTVNSVVLIAPTTLALNILEQKTFSYPKFGLKTLYHPS